jgi:hypothetical protein
VCGSKPAASAAMKPARFAGNAALADFLERLEREELRDDD